MTDIQSNGNSTGICVSKMLMLSPSQLKTQLYKYQTISVKRFKWFQSLKSSEKFMQEMKKELEW